MHWNGTPLSSHDIQFINAQLFFDIYEWYGSTFILSSMSIDEYIKWIKFKHCQLSLDYRLLCQKVSSLIILKHCREVALDWVFSHEVI